MGTQRIEKKVSRTASYTCFSRACATKEEDQRFRGPDTMAEVFLPCFIKYVFFFIPFFRKLLMKTLFPPGIYEYTLARTKLFDEIFQQALKHRFLQVVLLGAGFDTRALRFQNENKGTTIFELDAPITQQTKRDILRRKHVLIPETLTFVPIDFNKEQLAEVLGTAGYQQHQSTLFLWEGVTMYLTSAAVDSTLAFIRDSTAEGGLVTFDYVYASVLRGENTLYGEQNIAKTVSRVGEGWNFGIEDGEIESFLMHRGFTLVSHHTPAELEKQYLTADDGTVFGRVNGTHCIAVASVGPSSGVEKRRS
jgi:methyltransferase (TIGR00027 family)